ncbi:uncharacterized protein LOC116309087 [Actinia tenebrosa]|uniref:Uncharacterized protein LOC116309087 n=1 Tax=Actinia tenebrosa TaxID=6105 RepID=A0A6P8J5V0_ACTTE|nr:uncharacterized protein LOC116309087 [Actinia tenebrosa]
MVNCFVPDCDHHSDSHTCRFFGFPNKMKKKEEFNCRTRLIRIQDREPGEHSRVCSCHFREGKKSSGLEIFKRNGDKIFPAGNNKPPKTKKKPALKEDSFNVQTIVQSFLAAEDERKENLPRPSTEQVILATEVDVLKRELAT